MNHEQTVEYRKKRLQDFIDTKYKSSKAALGRALGYRDGAFVGQMLRGTRPITEKTVSQIQDLPGGNGWFSVSTGHAAATLTFTAAAIGSTAAPTVTSLDKRKEQRRSPTPGEVVDSLVSLLEKCDAAARDGLAGALPGLARDPSDPRAIVAVKVWLSPHEVERSKQANG